MQAANTTYMQECAQRCVNSLLHFTRLFYKQRTGRDFQLSFPPGRESHFITICTALERVFDGKSKRLIINVPPRYGKSELLIHWIAWCIAQYPDCNFMYVSYSHSLARKQTQTIRDIISMREYQEMFNVKLSDDAQAKDNFETTLKGSVYGVGAGGTLTGRGAGLKGVLRMGGAIVIDDILKPDEATSDTIREGINEWYHNTLLSRLNSSLTPIIYIGQRLHEDELVARLIASGEYELVCIPAIDMAGNPLYPEMHDIKTLRKMQAENEYVFSAQYMQNPIPAGGGLFKEHWFLKLDYTPKILATFITADTAETVETYNDASVFSFWGIYQLTVGDRLIPDTYCLHWLDCWELRVEPKDLQTEFMNFWRTCMLFPVKPTFSAIEKKSTGVTLLSSLKDIQGLRVIDIDRPRGNSKTNRFLEIQPFIAQKLITLPVDGKHTNMCIKHMSKITANESHKFDDIADTCAQAVKMALIDKVVINSAISTIDYATTAKTMFGYQQKVERLRDKAYRG
jgi:Uncharacterized protein conserved in bacteria